MIKKKLINEEGKDLSYKIQNYANRDLPRINFLKLVSKMILNFSGCDEIEIMISKGQKRRFANYEFICYKKKAFNFDIKTCKNTNTEYPFLSQDDLDFEHLCNNLLKENFNCSFPCFVQKNRIWVGNKINFETLLSRKNNQKSQFIFKNKKDFHSIALIPLMMGHERIGLLKLYSRKDNFFSKRKIELFKDLTQTLGLGLISQRSQAALHERIKELNCLYSITRMVETPNTALNEILQKTIELFPYAWQYPKITHGRIILDGHTYITPGFQEGSHIQSVNIMVNGKKRGTIEVIYTKKKPTIYEGPFLREERSLINNIASKLAIIIELYQVEEEKEKLQGQLLHADRLATLGLFTAGVAHELNEPLENILGFAQLAMKCPELPAQAQHDIEKIVRSSLYSREIIKKLMLFSRQTPSKKTIINLNQIINDGLYFLESRCCKEGIEVKRSYSHNLPEILADPAQLQQVLVNLVVNAIQAMPNGGILTIQTLSEKNYIELIVTDTGIGMTEAIKEKIFIPFFTTKDIGEGTGLGLSVAHGIVTSHQGSIQVKSQEGRGSCFIVQFPVNQLFQIEDKKR